MTFQLTLNNNTQPNSLFDPQRAKMISGQPLPEQLSLLIVDDEEFNLKSLKRLFRGQGFIIYTAIDGYEALKILEAQNIAIVISDMHMPKISGLDFLQKAHQQWPDTQLIVLTGYAEFEDAINVLNRVSIFKYLTKPWDDAYLLSAVHEAAAVYWGKLMDNYVETSTQEHNEELKFANQRLKHSVEQSKSQFVKVTEKLNSAYEGEKQLRRERREAQRLSQAKSHFLATMSHEIRTPLNAIIATNTLLLESDLNSEQLSLIKMSLNGGETLLALINDILDFSKICSGKFEFNEDWFNLVDMVEATCGLVSGQLANKAVDIAIVFNPGVPCEVYGDKKRLMQILTNLLSNAIKFTDKGCITVTASYNDALIMSVADTGIGIPEDKLGDIFEEFSQVDDSSTASQGGTGLGLSICKKLCHLMDGDIHATSVSGEGSQFTLRLPLANNNPIAFPMFEDQGASVLLLSQNKYLHASLEKQLSYFNCHLFIESQVPSDVSSYAAILYDLDTLCIGKNLHDIRKNHTLKNFALVGTTGADQCKALQDNGFDDILRKPLRITSLINSLIYQLNHKPSDAKLNADQRNRIERWLTPEIEVRQNALFDLAGARILLAEDSPSNQAIFTNVLNRMNAVVDVACNGAEAVALAKKQTYAVILMDVRMPEMDGLSATRIITQGSGINKKTPIIALTANVYTEDQKACFDAGMIDFLSKPIDMNRFRDCIVEWCPPPEEAVDQAKDTANNFRSKSSKTHLENTLIQNTAPTDNSCTVTIDLTIIDQLEKDTSADILPTILNIFTQETEKRLTDIADIQVSQDWNALAEQAHTLKSSAGSFGATELQGAARLLEVHLENSEYQKIHAEMKEFLALGQATIQAINHIKDLRQP